MVAEKKLSLTALSGMDISPSQYVSIIASLIYLIPVCSLFSGAMSGLTVGLLSIDMLELEIQAQIGTEAEKASVSITSEKF